MKLVDVHAHLDMEEFSKDLDKVIQHCKEVGVKAIITNGTNVESNRRVLDLAKKYDIVKAALGFYPTDTIATSQDKFDSELEFIKKKKPIAIGEVGLDKKWETYNPENKFKFQQERFQQLIDLAEKIKRPLILHTRKAELEVIEMMESSKAKANFHCFSGKKKLVQRIIENGWSMSIPANAFRVQQFQQNIEMLPLKQILTETDSPFLSGAESRNTPANVAKTIEVIAKIKKMENEEAANQVFMNYQRMFS